jgi:hypothetical protein
MAQTNVTQRDGEESCFCVLYTKHLVKKKKTYHDGFLRIRGLGSAVLLGENGQALASAKLAAKSLPLDPHVEGKFMILRICFPESLTCCVNDQILFSNAKLEA